MIEISVNLKIATRLNLVQTATKIRWVREQSADTRKFLKVADKCPGVEEVDESRSLRTYRIRLKGIFIVIGLAIDEFFVVFRAPHGSRFLAYLFQYIRIDEVIENDVRPRLVLRVGVAEFLPLGCER